MSSYTYLAKNMGLLTVSSFATKLLSFFLVPLYTSVLSTADYGTYDLFITTIGVLMPLLTLNVQEAVLRFAMDRDANRAALITLSTRYIAAGNAIVAVGLALNYVFAVSETVAEYSLLFFLMYLTQSLSSLVLSYIRGIDRIMLLSVSSVIASAITIGCNILFLLVWDWGLTGYFVANIVGPLGQALFIVYAARMYTGYRCGVAFPTERAAMLRYSLPMVPNSLAWWVIGASDKYVVIFFCGLAESGIYAVASKIPSIINVVTSIFGQAWTLSAVKDFDPEDRNGFFTHTYRAYNCIVVIMCSALIVSDEWLAHFLYANDFYAAWRYVPWLTIATVFGALSSYLGGIFSAKKDSAIFAQSSIAGAVSNLVLNLLTIPFVGALGAAIATAVSFFLMWLLRFIRARRYIRMRIPIYRDVATYALLVVQSVALLLLEVRVLLYGAECALFMLIVALYAQELRQVVAKVTPAIRARLRI